MFTRRLRTIIKVVIVLVALVVQVLCANSAHAELPGINPEVSTTAVKVGGTGDPTSTNTPMTPADWVNIPILYPAAIPLLSAMIGQETYDQSTQIAIDKAVAEINKVPVGQNAVLMGNSQGGDAVDRAANAADRPVTVYTLGGPNGPGGAARVLPNLPGVTFYQNDPNPHVYKVDYKIRGDGVTALRNPLEGGNAPLGTAANLLGYFMFHLGFCPDENYVVFREDRVIYTPNGEIRIMDATHPVVKLAEMANLGLTEEQKRDIEVAAPVGEPGQDSFAATPQQLWSLGAPTTAAKPADETTPVISNDPLAQARVALEEGMQNVAVDFADQVENFVTQATITAPAISTIPVETSNINEIAEIATQVAPQFTDEISDIQEAVSASPFAQQANNLLAGILPAPVQ